LLHFDQLGMMLVPIWNSVKRQSKLSVAGSLLVWNTTKGCLHLEPRTGSVQECAVWMCATICGDGSMLLWRTTQLPFRFRTATRTQVAGSTVSSGNINLEEVIQVLLTCCLSFGGDCHYDQDPLSNATKAARQCCFWGDFRLKMGKRSSAQVEYEL
jgi:hypothetical protein